MSKLRGHLLPPIRNYQCDPSPARRPPLTPQLDWVKKELRKNRLLERSLFLRTTHFKIVSRVTDGGPSELLKLLFSYGNMRYETQMLTDIDWKSLMMKTPHGNLPVLWIDHNPYGEPNAIVRHLASHLGLLGRNESERLVLEAVLAQVEAIRDSDCIQKAFEEISDKRIDDNAELLMEDLIPKHFEFWEQHIQNTPGPYITGSGISVADMSIYDFLQQHMDHLPLLSELEKYTRLLNLFGKVPHHPRLASHFFPKPDAEEKSQ